MLRDSKFLRVFFYAILYEQNMDDMKNENINILKYSALNVFIEWTFHKNNGSLKGITIMKQTLQVVSVHVTRTYDFIKKEPMRVCKVVSFEDIR